MIPIQLNIKGLYSYQENISIDFQPLVAARLFGIFGPVGSGKSAILEAIMFVLFDRSTRLNKAGDDRYYNMMNLQSNEMIIDFIFKAGSNNQDKFRFYFKARRKAKDFDKVEIKDRSYYKWSKNDWLPIDSSKVIGMTYENFMQTVIIPQGKFREFIDQKPAARTQMLKELFHLEKFDLSPQSHALLHEVRDQLTYLQGQLSLYQDLHEKVVKELQTEVTKKQGILEKQTKEHQKLQKSHESLQELLALTEELNQTQGHLTTLNQERDFYLGKEAQLRRFEKALELFKSKLDLQKTYLSDLKRQQQQIESLTNSQEALCRTLTKKQGQLEQVQELLKNKESWRLELEDLQIIIEYNQQKVRFEEISLKWQSEQSQLKTLKTAQEKLLKDLKHWVAQSESHRDAQEQHRLWTEKARWWQREEELKQRNQSIEEAWSKITNEVKDLSNEKALLKTVQIPWKKLPQQLASAEARLQELRIKENWQEHAQHLSDDTPCPLCGSVHHPQVLTSEEIASDLSKVDQEIKELKDQEKLFQENVQQVQVTETRLKLQSARCNQLKQELAKASEELTQLRKTFPGKTVIEPPPDLSKKLKQLHQQTLAGEQAQQQVNILQEQHHELQAENLRHINSAQEIGLEREQLQGALDQKLKSIKYLEPTKLLGSPKSVLQARIVEIETISQQAVKSYDAYQQEVLIMTQESTRQEATIESLQRQSSEMALKSQQLDKELETLCKKESFKGLQEVQTVLALGLNTEQERNEIAKYHQEVTQYSQGRNKLQKAIGKRKYQEETHGQVREQLQQLTTDLESLRHEVAGKQHALKEKQEQLVKKHSLISQEATLSLRKDQLQEISNLLRGNGFINFISSVYLQNLCKMANVRFAQLTSNRLSLELNNQNDFMVRDYLNDGKLRLLKTLSGGQIFQASLCLALALAENVKTLNQADQSFFFLDEGFGSLDKSSIQIVFNTLKSLQKENRVVGIISHVEELQQEIDVYLSVQQIGEKGSKVTPSWEKEHN